MPKLNASPASGLSSICSASVEVRVDGVAHVEVVAAERAVAADDRRLAEQRRPDRARNQAVEVEIAGPHRLPHRVTATGVRYVWKYDSAIRSAQDFETSYGKRPCSGVSSV